MSSAAAATGEQYEISHGTWRAVVTEQGATLRSLCVAGVELLAGFDADESPAGCRGQQLMPWPNRIRDGHWSFHGSEHQLPITEPDRHNAIHGLVSWAAWQLVDLGPNQVTQQFHLLPQPGWPGQLLLTITHALSDDGLSVRVRAENQGGEEVPFGYAAHPYLRLAQGTLDDWDLDVPFASWLAVDQRLLPVDLKPVAGTDRALSGGEHVGSRRFDTAFRSPRLEHGRWQVRLSNDEQAVTMWGDESLRWLQVYTPEDRASVALEPMSVGPDAFNDGPTHADLTVLAPGAAVEHVWGIGQA